MSQSSPAPGVDSSFISLAMTAPKLHNAPSNWFLHWDQQDPHHQKTFSLQVKLQNLSNRDFFRDTIHSCVVLYCRTPTQHTWQEIGKTATIYDDPNPAFPEGFRISYQHQEDLTAHIIKLVCFCRRDPILSNLQVLGTATISLRELLRAYGTRVQVELIKRKTNKTVGSVWFLGEQLPLHSPRSPSNAIIQFNISVVSLRAPQIQYYTPRLFLLVERERQDSTWACVYRSDVSKRASIPKLISRDHLIRFTPFQIRQSELVLSMSQLRRIRFSFLQKGKRGEPHTCVGHVLTNIDEVFNDFVEDTSLDLRVEGNVVGEFACASKKQIDKITTFEVQVDYFDMEKEARAIEERRKNKTLNLDSP